MENKSLVLATLKWGTSPLWGLILGIAYLIYFRKKLKEKDLIIAKKDKTIKQREESLKEYWANQKQEEKEEVPEVLATYNKSLVKKGNRVFLQEARNFEVDWEAIARGEVSLNEWYRV